MFHGVKLSWFKDVKNFTYNFPFLQCDDKDKENKKKKDVDSTKVQHYICVLHSYEFLLILGWLHHSCNKTCTNFTTEATGKQILITNTVCNMELF